MKVALVYTGGTIGSSSSDDGVRSLDRSKDDYLLTKFDDKDIIECFHPYLILSENLDGSHITKLLGCIGGLLGRDYDGIIVTHGTDTIQYSAAALSYAFGSDTIPIMLLSSNAPVGEEGSNADDNTFAAIDFIRNGRGMGVFVPYKNSDGVTYIHRGTRLLAHSMFDDSLRSIFGAYYGRYADGGYSSNPEYKEKVDEGTPLGTISLGNNASGVEIIRPHPGMQVIELKEGTTDLILATYHSGTLPDSMVKQSGLLEMCADMGIRVWVTGCDPDVVYEGMANLKNVEIMPMMTDISTFMKIWMAIIGERGMDFVKIPLGGDL